MQKIQMLLIVVVLAGVGWYVYDRYIGITPTEFVAGTYSTIQIDGIPIRVDIADTQEERKQGLSGRSGLEDSTGLLMVFDEPGYYGIWMKDMRFAIDVIWIGEDLHVIKILQHLTPDTYPEIFEPEQPAKYILETKAFFTDVYGLDVGDKVLLPETLEE